MSFSQMSALSWHAQDCSALFERLPILLAEQIKQPMLRQLACHLQDSIIADSGVEIDLVNGELRERQQQAVIRQSLQDTDIADASVLVAITDEPVPKLLLTRRARHLTAHAGEVSCVGGKYEPDDGNNVITAVREAYEETALSPDSVQLLGQLPIQTSKRGLSVRPIVALVEPNQNLVAEVGEIARIFWADFATLVDQPMQDYAVSYRIKGVDTILLTPSWVIDGEIVWGLTGRVLASLLEVGFGRKIEWYYRPQV